MSIIKTKTSESSFGWKKFILPGYIVLSALFILVTLYTYFQWVVYRSGVATWEQQAVQTIMTRVSQKCEAIALTLGESQVDIVNAACVQQSGNNAPAPTETTPSNISENQ